MLFSILEAHARRHAALPTIVFRLRIAGADEVEAIVLRTQIRIDPHTKNSPAFAWADIPVMVPAFSGETEVDVNVPCTYDFDVTATRYFAARDEEAIPLRFFFSGSIFRREEQSFSVAMLSWQSECSYRMPLSVWRDAMRECYGDSVLVRISRETFELLQRIRTERHATNWDDVITRCVTT